MDNVQKEWIFLKDVLTNSKHLILGCNLVAPDAFTVASSIIYSTALDLFKRDEEVSFESVAIELDKTDKLKIIGGIEFLNTLKEVDFIPTDAVFSKMCDELARTGKVKQVKKILSEISETDTDNPDELIAQTINSLYKVSDVESTNIVDLKTLIETRKPRMPIASTTITALDDILGGFVEGEYTIVAARPSVGKTSLCNQIALMSAIAGNATLMISLEQSKTSLGNRLNNLLDYYGFDKEVVDNTPLYIDTTSGLTMPQIFYKVQMAKLLYGIRVVLIDYIGLIGGRKAGQNANDFMQQVSRQMQIISRKLDVALIVASQLNRNSETEGREPQLYDLRDSGALEQDVDNAIFIHRPKLGEDAVIIVAKGREVGIGRTTVKFCPDTMMFVDDN